MSQSQQADRRLGEDRRSEPRETPDRRRGIRNLWECIYDAVQDIYKWTDIPAQNGETGLVKRNWRTWFGHATVATLAVAIGRWLGLHVSFFWPAVGSWVPIVFAVGVGLFYFWREYGIGTGDYWQARKAKRQGYDAPSDSVIDFWIVLPPIFILMQTPIIWAVLVAIIMTLGIYLMSKLVGF